MDGLAGTHPWRRRLASGTRRGLSRHEPRSWVSRCASRPERSSRVLLRHVEDSDRGVVDRRLDAGEAAQAGDGAGEVVELGLAVRFQVEEGARLRLLWKRYDEVHDPRFVSWVDRDAAGPRDRERLADAAGEEKRAVTRGADRSDGRAGEAARGGERRDERELSPEVGLDVRRRARLDSPAAEDGGDALRALRDSASE